MRIVIVLVLISASFFSHPVASTQFCTNCINISSPKYLYKPSEHVVIFLSVIAANITNYKADIYVALIHPNGKKSFVYQVLNWQVKDITNKNITFESLGNKEIGQYQLHFILAEPGADPLDSNNWLATKGTVISLLPESWQEPEQQQEVILSNGRELPHLIAHGGGEVAGHLVTNSLQALNNAYALGHRFIELDLSWTIDRQLVLIHDWDITYRRLFSQDSKIPDLKKFDRLIMNYGLTQLNFKQLLDWLNNHPDVRVVTDIKERNLEGLAYIAEKAGETQKQFIPQIYTKKEYNRVKALNFQDVIFTLYRSAISDTEVLIFVKNNPLVALTLPINRAIKSSLALNLKANGVFVYAHTVNLAEVYKYLQDRGVSGIYSDKLFPAKNTH